MLEPNPKPDRLRQCLRLLGLSGLPKTSGFIWWVDRRLPVSDAVFEVDFFGHRYEGCLNQKIDKSVWYFGVYEPAELNLIKGILNEVRRQGEERIVLLDIGANVGHHSLFLSSYADQIIAFEPAIEASEKLRARMAKNQIANVTLYNVALGEADSSGFLGSGFDGNSGSRSLLWTFDPEKNEKVIVRHADAFMAEINCPKIHVIKMDVEGFEKTVLTGLRNKIAADRPIILFEMVGNQTRGGFEGIEDLHSTVLGDCTLFGVHGRTKPFLRDYVWEDDAVLLVPNEKLSLIQSFRQ